MTEIHDCWMFLDFEVLISTKQNNDDDDCIISSPLSFKIMVRKKDLPSRWGPNALTGLSIAEKKKKIDEFNALLARHVRKLNKIAKQEKKEDDERLNFTVEHC